MAFNPEDMTYVTLSNGVRMPQLGYGVYQVGQGECERCVVEALEAGYRHIDTAQSYFNERQVGAAIAASPVAREDVFLTTKVWIEHYGQGATRASVEESLRKLRTDYLDLVLLHQPFGDVFGAWRDLVGLYGEGKLRAIGVSNFYADRLVEFCEFNDVKPMVNQMERHPLNQNVELQQWEAQYGVQPEAWAPFGEGRGGLFKNPVLTGIGEAHGKTAAQVMLRWNLQRGVAVIPKSVHRERMEQNLDVFDFELTQGEMGTIAELDTATSSFFSHADPKMVQWFAQMVEQRKVNHDGSAEKKAW
jgi:2,5-diketo-D-gluconate reductase A